MSWYMRHQLLNDCDWAGMAHSVEIRTPFVDVALLNAVAPWLVAHPGITKQQVVRRTVPAMPEPSLKKSKTGFTTPVRQWLGMASRSTRGLRGWAQSVFDEQSRERNAGKDPSSMSHAPRVLVSTIASGNGGVNAMTGFVIRNLASLGFEPVIAHYAPYSLMPHLSVPSFRLLQRGARSQQGVAHGKHEIHAIGAWLPELEFTHYVATRHWRRLISSCDAHVAVSGNVLAATALCQTGRPYLAWVATDWQGDRQDRVKHFPWVRRLLDRYINGPVIRRLERKLLVSGRVLSLSHYTARKLADIAGQHFKRTILSIPVDSELFVPDAAAVVPGRLGFAGRFNDPRKNIGLLLQAVALLRETVPNVSLVLMGDVAQASVTGMIDAHCLKDRVSIKPGLSRGEMRDCMQTLDVFVLPSHQEGLCISALEAMACGVPVVSTRCGGPEEFVVPGVTGALVDSDAAQMAAAIALILGNRTARFDLGQAARRMVQEQYGERRAQAVFTQAFRHAFPAVGGGRCNAKEHTGPDRLSTDWALRTSGHQ
jgi:glycosyltransferase involved in cell wall biosynthesis